MKVNVDSPDEISLLLYQSHEDGSVIKAYGSNPCSLCNGNAETHFHGSEVGACSRKTYYFKVYGKQDQGFNSTTFLSDGHLHEASMLKNIEQGLPEGWKIKILENGSEQVTELLGFKLVLLVVVVFRVSHALLSFSMALLSFSMALLSFSLALLWH